MSVSLRWLLMAMAYVALVAGAIFLRSELLADAVWLTSLAAVFCAAVATVVTKGMRRTLALGFVIWSAAYIAGLSLMPNRLPANRLLAALGHHVSGGLLYVIEIKTDPNSPLPIPQLSYIESSGAIVSTANAVGTLLAGLIGAGIGALAAFFPSFKWSWRFSLRTLLIVTTLVAIALGLDVSFR